jgi:hypothetical protein
MYDLCARANNIGAFFALYILMNKSQTKTLQ